MINQKYARAYTEILEILSYFSKNDYSKIPTEIIDYYKKNMDKNYVFSINPNMNLDQQNISKETYSIFIELYKRYYATEEEIIKINEILKLKNKKDEQKKLKKYESYELFKTKREKNIEEIKENNLVEYKESFFTKLKNFIFKLFNINY